MKKVSLRDIAEELGVSKTLVSLVLNGKAKENRISQEVIDKVKKVAKEKGYEPNQFAKALRTGKSNTIGLIVADISNSFYSKMARSVEDEAYNSNYTVLFGSSDEDPEKAEKLIKVMLDRQIDGLIICPTVNGHRSIELIAKHKVPYVLVDRPVTGIESGFIGVNNLDASCEAVSALIRQGAKKIAHINFYQELSNMNDRFNGYVKAHRDMGMEIDNSLFRFISNDRAIDEVHEFIDSVSNQADAYFFANNEITLIAIKYFMQSDTDQHANIKIACFDDHEAFHLLSTNIGVITQPVVEMGKKALELLLEKIEGNGVSDQNITLVTEYRVLNQDTLKK
ncbi:MAG: LacI family DNA-binding transcriptional regulator [Cyclobacteriaceae bacterium]|nr:LacI family DNA-binding transcriptional regulator [Cyclobacteriaceae bacterium SS2]